MSSCAAGGGAGASGRSSSARSRFSATSASSPATRGESATRRSGRRSGGGDVAASAASSGSQSATLRAIGPAWSSVGPSGKMPRIDTRPRVGLMVEVPHSADGMRNDPAVSVPVAAGVVCEASAAAEPPLEPPGDRSSDHGLPT
jgi:hypothetical protein